MVVKVSEQINLQNNSTLNQRIWGDIINNVNTYGARGDYYLDDGSVNPNPTDNTPYIQAAFNESNYVFFGKGVYYCSGSINLPKDPKIEGNYATIVFANDGFNLGDHIWNRPEFKNITISNYQNGKTGNGIFSVGGYIVFPSFNNVRIYGFNKGIYFDIDNQNSNCTWANFNNVKFQYCIIGMHLKGGWFNTVKFSDLEFNLIEKHAILFDNIIQFHNVVIDKLILESCGSDKDSLSSPVLLKQCANGELTISNVYIENNGYSRVATPTEISNFQTNGTKINGYFYDSKSYLLNGEIYSEDTNRITLNNIGSMGIFEFNNCGAELLFTLNNAFVSSDLLPITSFVNSRVNPIINYIHLVNKGFSYPNVRKPFVNTSPVTNPVTITGNYLTNSGGGSNFKYDDVTYKGDKFGGITSKVEQSQGEWTPVLSGTHTYVTQTGRYFKVGNLVTAYFNIRLSSKGGSGVAHISGLPFAVKNIPDYTPPTALSFYSGVTPSTAATQISGYVNPGGTNINLAKLGSGLAFANLNLEEIGNGFRIAGAITYEV